MIMNGRAISPGKVRGTVIVYPEPFSFLGGVDGSTGNLNVADGNIAGKVFVFPNGKGSTVGSYVVYDLMVHGCAPAALVNSSAETIVTTGAVISGVPMVDSVDISLLRDGDIVTVDGNEGTIDVEGVGERRVAIVVPTYGGKIAMKRQDADSHAHGGKLVPIYGFVGDGDAKDAANEALAQCGISDCEVGEPVVFEVRGKHTVYEVSLFSAGCSGCSVPEGCESVDPEDIGGTDVVDGFADILKRL